MIKVAIIGGNGRIRETLKDYLIRQNELKEEEINLCDKKNFENDSNTYIIDIDKLVLKDIILTDEMVKSLENSLETYIPTKKIKNDYSRIKINRQDVKKNNYEVNQKIKNYKR